MTVQRKVHSCLLLKKVILLKNQNYNWDFEYDQFISSKYVAVSRLKVHKRFRETSKIPVKQLCRRNPKQIQEKKVLIANICQEKCAKVFQDTSIYVLYRDKHYGKKENKKELQTTSRKSNKLKTADHIEWRSKRRASTYTKSFPHWSNRWWLYSRKCGKYSIYSTETLDASARVNSTCEGTLDARVPTPHRLPSEVVLSYGET